MQCKTTVGVTLAINFVFCSNAFAGDEVLSRIEGAKPRNVVFILSDDHRYDRDELHGTSIRRDAAHGFDGQKRCFI